MLDAGSVCRVTHLGSRREFFRAAEWSPFLFGHGLSAYRSPPAVPRSTACRLRFDPAPVHPDHLDEQIRFLTNRCVIHQDRSRGQHGGQDHHDIIGRVQRMSRRLNLITASQTHRCCESYNTTAQRPCVSRTASEGHRPAGQLRMAGDRVTDGQDKRGRRALCHVWTAVRAVRRAAVRRRAGQRRSGTALSTA